MSVLIDDLLCNSLAISLQRHGEASDGHISLAGEWTLLNEFQPQYHISDQRRKLEVFGGGEGLKISD